MTKKKILSLCMVAALATTAFVGGTLAYFTDTDTARNTFTYGDVDIKLNENFPDNELLPGEKNAVLKDVTVTNIGTEDAYLWMEMWIPEKIDDGDPTLDASANNLHFNPFDTYKLSDGTLKPMRGSEAKKLGLGGPVAVTVETSLGKKEMNGITYNGYRQYIKNDTAKKTGEETYSLLYQVFMDKDVKQCTDLKHDDNCLVLKDGTHYTGSWEIIVNAFGIQADGFANIEEAIAAYDGE